MQRLLRTTLLSLGLTMLLGGCVRTWSGIFINATDHSLSVRMEYGPERTTRVAVFQLRPGGQYKLDVTFASLAVVSDGAGHVWYQQPLPLGDLRHRYAMFRRFLDRAGTFHFLVADQGLYPIPLEYRENWQDHVEEIITASPLDPAASP